MIGAAAAWAAKDPVIMTVNGVDVPLSEFEYLYNKNNQQQLAPQSLDDYLEMFKLYKLKVADARDEGIDTTAAFIKEMKQYRRDLAAPYMADSTFYNKLIDESYNRSQEEVEAKHIMFMKTRDFKQNQANRQLLDSIRTAILNGADFSEMAREYSQDKTAATNGGNLGFIAVNRFPYSFETAVYSLKDGELSEIVESNVGYHLLMGGRHRKARGTVLAEHIMKLVPAMAPRGREAEQKHQIDSIYNLVINDPESFEKLAGQLSDDKGSARVGGRLPWFGAGEMVAEFDSTAFALQDGEISAPIRSQYGWHIIKRIAGRPVMSREELAKVLLPRLDNPQDERYKMVKNNLIQRLARKHKGKIDEKVLNEMILATETNGIDSAYLAEWRTGAGGSQVIFTVGPKSFTVYDVTSKIKNNGVIETGVAREYVNGMVNNSFAEALMEAEEDYLDRHELDYHNLLKEYEDGSLLYEVSVEKVWDRASKDKDGLKDYFEKHRQDYKWKEPKAKGYLIQTLNDSVADLVKARIVELSPDSIIPVIRKEFSPNVTIEKCLASKGTNAIVDELMFGGKEVGPSIPNFKTYFMYDGRIIQEPEEVADAQGQVTSDYQNEFQTTWEEELRSRYPVTVNEKVLKKIRKKN